MGLRLWLVNIIWTFRKFQIMKQETYKKWSIASPPIYCIVGANSRKTTVMPSNTRILKSLNPYSHLPIIRQTVFILYMHWPPSNFNYFLNYIIKRQKPDTFCQMLHQICPYYSYEYAISICNNSWFLFCTGLAWFLRVNEMVYIFLKTS